MFGTDPLEELSIPDGTQIKEHDLVTDGDVFIGGQSAIELGLRGGTVVAGERVTVTGDVEADGDCRLDMWCEIDGNVLVGSDAYLGERVHITGQLIVSGDLDIGDDVEIERGFEANGWIVIRNPVPTIVFLFVYLSHLLRIGENEAAADVANEFLSEGGEDDPVVIPRGSRVSDDSWRVSTPATIGDDCRLHGNLRAAEIDVGSGTEVFGSLRAKASIRVGSETVVHGDVTTSGGDVLVAPDAHVRGGISCERCRLSEAAEVEGTIRARDGITLEDAETATSTAIDSNDDETTDARETVDDAGSTAEKAVDKNPVDRGTMSTDKDPIPVFVPIEDGSLPVSRHEPDESEGVSRAFVPLDSVDSDSKPTLAIVPIEASGFEWAAVDSPRTDGDESGIDTDQNGSGSDVTTIVTDADDR